MSFADEIRKSYLTDNEKVEICKSYVQSCVDEISNYTIKEIKQDLSQKSKNGESSYINGKTVLSGIFIPRCKYLDSSIEISGIPSYVSQNACIFEKIVPTIIVGHDREDGFPYIITPFVIQKNLKSYTKLERMDIGGIRRSNYRTDTVELTELGSSVFDKIKSKLNIEGINTKVTIKVQYCKSNNDYKKITENIPLDTPITYGAGWANNYQIGVPFIFDFGIYYWINI